MKILRTILPLIAVLLIAGCGQQSSSVSEQEESQEAKRLLQGAWLEEDTETFVFRMKGDTIYYADSTSMPEAFKVVGDTLYIGNAVRYVIEKQTEHVLWFKSLGGETMKFYKNTEQPDDSIAAQIPDKPQILTLTEVLKRDTVVFYDNNRYHLYLAVNPTKYKVSKHTLNEDGLDVENVYYDNIIHLSIFQGATQLFSRDFRRQFFERHVPKNILPQTVLNDMQYTKTDAKGFHFNTSICIPDGASCYLVEVIVGRDGKTSTKLLEY